MSEKMAKRIRRLDARVTALERRADRNDQKWAEAMATSVREIAEQEARRVSRRQVRHAEWAVSNWKRRTYAVLIASIIVLVAAILVVNADAEDAETIDPPVVATAAETTVKASEEPEELENERIEAALLARAQVIEDCTITFYCNERYPHICGTGDDIAYDGTADLAWATCAVDPDVIPLGSTVMADLGDGYGLRTLVANDTGVKGNHIDICVESHNSALQLGRQTAKVYWCEE